MVEQYELWFRTKMHGFDQLEIVHAQFELYHGGTKRAMVMPPKLRFAFEAAAGALAWSCFPAFAGLGASCGPSG